MATKKVPHLSRKQRKEFISAMLARFIPKLPSVFFERASTRVAP